MKISIEEIDGTIIEIEGDADEVTKVLKEFGFGCAHIEEPAPAKTIKPEELTVPNTDWWFAPKYTYNACPNGGFHEYPSVWFGVGMPPCSKCGSNALYYTPTMTTFTLADLDSSNLTIQSSGGMNITCNVPNPHFASTESSEEYAKRIQQLAKDKAWEIARDMAKVTINSESSSVTINPGPLSEK